MTYLPLDEYRDQYGVITQHPEWGADAGDSAHRHGIEYLFNGTLSKPISYFYTKEGTLIRHPEGLPVWVREKDRSSRDQNTPWLAAFAVHGNKEEAKRVAKAVLSNYSRFHNFKKNGTLDAPDKFPDVAGPEIWALFIRGMRIKILYPVLYILDLETLAGTLFWNWGRSEHDSDNTNHIALLKASNEVMPTFVSKLALKLLNKEKAILKLKHYWDVQGFSLEPNKDPGQLGDWIIKWLEKQ